jgi:hypothetical protein
MSDDSTNPSAPLPSLGAPPAATTGGGAPSSDPPAVDTATLPIIDDYYDKANTLLNKTLGALNKHGRHKDSGLHSEIMKKLKKIVGVIHEVMAKADKFVEDNNGHKHLPITALNPNKKLWGETGSYFMHLGNRKKVGAAFSESEGGFYVRITDQFDEKGQELNDDNAFVLMTLDDMMKLSEGYPELKKMVMELMQICPAFSGYYDDEGGQHREKLFEHCLIAVFETYFAFVIDGSDPGYIAERILNFGSEDIWRYLTSPSIVLNEVAIEWLKVLPSNIQCYVLATWQTYIGAIRSYIRKNGMTSNDEVMAMLHDDLYQWFLKRHTLLSIWGGGGPDCSGTCLLDDKKEFPDAVYCPIFAEVETVAKSIIQVMEEHEIGKLDQAEARSQFKSHLDTIKKHTKAYVEPDDEALRNGGQVMLSSMIEEIKVQPEETALLTTEISLWSKFDKDYLDDITRGAKTCDVKTVMSDDDENPTIAGTLYKIRLNGKRCKTLLIFVGCSPHVTLGYGSTMTTRLSQASKQIATSSVLEEAGLIDEGSTNKLVKRFRFFFINAEGPFGNLFGDGPDSKREVRFYYAVRLTLPLGYYLEQFRKGVVALANEICPGMLKHHAVALMVIMRYDNFCNFLRLHCGLELGLAENLEGKLAEMSDQRKKRQTQRLARLEILQILRKKPEERTEEDFENLEECRALIHRSHTSQQYDDAKILIMTLEGNPTKDDFTEVAEEVYKILTDHVSDNKFGKLRKFYQEVSVDFTQSVIDGLFAATLQIQFREKLGGETNANPFHAPSAAVEELID